MTPKPTDEPRCPRCGEEKLVDYDCVLGRFNCSACGASWAPKKGK